jgi:hypothetical protein
MNKARLVILLLLAASFISPAIAGPGHEAFQGQSIKVGFFDVSDLPARIDEPRLRRDEGGFVLDCAVANRSSEQLLGLRLILMVVEPSGKLRNRIAWAESSELGGYSIKVFAFHPVIKGELRHTDQLFLSVDEVIGRETIWRVDEAEKALRAYSRGRHDVMPTVRTVANKFDPRTEALRKVIY